MGLRAENSGTSLQLLAPGNNNSILPVNLHSFPKVTYDSSLRRHLLDEMQRFRGAIALAEGAVSRERLTSDGRHEMPVDHASWHLLLRRNGAIAGCMRYAAYAASARATDLQIWNSALARSREWSFSLRAAIEKELAGARRRNIHFGEPGGWVIAPDLRGTTEAIKLALSGFALALALGGAVGVCTATRKNHSAAMLRRLGGRPLGFGETQLPAYFEPTYGCEIEVLTFDSETLAGSYRQSVESLCRHLATEVPVLAPPEPRIQRAAEIAR